ncbi:MAG TPA: hypothetical protein VHQ47_09985 [Phycisphaerae bacterium]|nr:hypothetical protein [Phycisphaerae bacterium]
MSEMKVAVGEEQAEARAAVRAALLAGEGEEMVFGRLRQGGWSEEEARGLVEGVKADLGTAAGQGATWEAARGFVKTELGKGRLNESVVRELVGAGWQQGEGERFVEEMRLELVAEREAARAGGPDARSAEMRRAIRNMKVGGIWLVGGAVVTLGTMSMAGDGGHYVLAWGAIVFGGLQFGMGVLQWVSGGGGK